jgi:hypothetical protein
VENPKGKRPLERPRHKWEDGIRMNLREISWGSECRLDSVSSGQGLVLGSCEHSDDPSSSDATDLVHS